MREEGITRLAPRLRSQGARDAIARLWRFFELTLKQKARRASRYGDKQNIDSDAIATDAFLSYISHLQGALTRQMPSSRSSMRSTLIRRVWKRVKRERRHQHRFQTSMPDTLAAAADGNPFGDYEAAKSQLLEELRLLLKPRVYQAYVLSLTPLSTDQIAERLQRSRRVVQRYLKQAGEAVDRLCEEHNA